LSTADNGNVYLYDLSGNILGQIMVSGLISDFIAPTVFSSDGTRVILAGRGLRYYTLSSGTYTFSGISTRVANKYITYLATVDGDTNTLYTGGAEGELYFTSDRGTSWKRFDSGQPTVVVGAIAANKNSEHDILVGYQNTGIQHLWQCLDVTASTPVWTSVSGSGNTALPDVPISAIVRMPFDPANNWYVATDLGVYVTTNAGQSWALVNGLPEVQIYDLKYAAGYLYAGTFGRGIWRIPVVGLEQIRLQPTTVQGGQQTAVAFYLSAPTGSPITVNVASSSPDAVLASSTINIPQGAQAGNVLIHTLPVSATETITISGTYNGTRLYRLLTLQPATLTGIKVAPAALQGGATGALAVYLNGPTGSSGASVSLSSSSTDVTVPTSVTVSPGATAANVAVTTVVISVSEQVTLSATFGSTTLSTTLTLNPPLLTGANLQYPTVIGGAPTALALYLNARAGTNGATIALNSSSTDAVIASSVTIPQGLGSANVVIHTAPVSASEQITISASFGSSTITKTLTLNPVALNRVRLLPTSVIGGNSTALAVYLNGPAGLGGTVVTLLSGSGDATIPATVTVPAGASSASVFVNTVSVSASEQVSISATLGSTTLSTPLTIRP
jgi:hypothetical protein